MAGTKADVARGSANPKDVANLFFYFRSVEPRHTFITQARSVREGHRHFFFFFFMRAVSRDIYIYRLQKHALSVFSSEKQQHVLGRGERSKRARGGRPV